MSSKYMRSIMESLDSDNAKSLNESTTAKPVTNQIKNLISEGLSSEQTISIIAKSPVLRESAISLLKELFGREEDEDKDDDDDKEEVKESEDDEEDDKNDGKKKNLPPWLKDKDKETANEGISWMNKMASTPGYTLIIETTSGTVGKKTFANRKLAFEWVNQKQDQIVKATAIESIMEKKCDKDDKACKAKEKAKKDKKDKK